MKNKKSMLKRAFSILLCMAVFFTAIPGLEAYAEGDETTAMPEISIPTQIVRAGEYVTVYVQASNFTNVGALELAVYYDDEIFRNEGAWQGWLADGAVMDTNTGTSGSVKMSLISLNGINGSGELLGLTFYTKKEAATGKSQLKLAVTGMYDLDGNSISVKRTSGVINVKEPLTSLKKAEFGTYFYNYQVEEGQELTYVLQSYEIGDLAGGDFKFEYDADVLEVSDVILSEIMLNNSPTYSVNKDKAGVVRVTYANSHAINHNWYELIRITFRAKTTTSYSEIKFTPSGLVGADLEAMSGNTYTQSFSVTPKSASATAPEFILSGENSVEAGQIIELTASVPGASKISAGDFTITYNKNYMVCTSVTVDEKLTAAGGIVVTKEDIGNGTVKFSYVNTKPSGSDTALVQMTFEAKKGVKGNTTVSVKGKDLVDEKYQDVTLKYPSKTIKITACAHTYGDWTVTKEATCTSNGSRYKVCSKCGNESKETIYATGHDMVYEDEMPATCTQPGYSSGGSCKNCDHKVEAGQIPVLGHDYDDGVVTQEPTEETSGVMTFTCVRCGTQQTNEIPPLNSGVCRHGETMSLKGYEATCTSYGLTDGIQCASCWEILIAQQSIPPYGHNYNDGVMMPEPTETDWGAMEYTCYKCGDRYYVNIPPLGEGGCSHYNVLTLDRIEPTCTETGLTEGRQCTDCGTMIIPQEVIGTKAHDTYKVDYVQPTCIENGCNQYWQCFECGRLFGDVYCSWEYGEPPVIYATGHMYEYIYGYEPSCTESGLTEGARCAVCYMILTHQEVIPAWGHAMVVQPAVEPTCTSSGLTEGRYCDNCGYVEAYQDYRDVLTHKYGSWTTSKRATISAPGSMVKTCKYCGQKISQKIVRIKKTTLSKAQYVYDGKVKKPVVTVVNFNGAKLKAGTDYTVTIRNAAGKIVAKPKAVGKYKVTVTFKGKYKGTVNKWYTVNPKGTVLGKVTSPAKKQLKVTWTKKPAAQVTGYQIRYGTKKNLNLKGSKMVLVQKAKTNNKVIKNLKPKTKYWVQIRTYKTVNGVKYFSAWSAKKQIRTK